MARFNEILVGRYNRFLQKFLSMKGGPPAPQLSSEIAAVWALFHGAENRYLEAWDRFGVAANVAAAAGFQSGFRFRNPPGSNVIAVFEKIGFNTAAGLVEGINLLNGTATADLTTAIALTGTGLDTRSRGQPTLIGSQQNTTALVPILNNQNQYGAAQLPGSANFDFVLFEDQEIPVLPGSALQFTAGAVNQALAFNVMWRERVLEDSERA